MKIGLVWHGDREARDTVTLLSSRFAGAAASIEAFGMEPVGVVYNDDFLDEVRNQILGLDAIQVWVNPNVGGRDRSKLDAMLREVSINGVRVFTHPDLIMKMGTKQILFDTASASFGSDVQLFTSLEDLRLGLSSSLQNGAKVLKQYRGHSGGGIWKFSAVDGTGEVLGSTPIDIRHAERGCPIERLSVDSAVERMAPYFEARGKMFVQPFQTRIGEGMIRIYMVQDEVAGFGHQAAVALAPETENGELPDMGPRLYYPPNEPEFGRMRHLMDSLWLGELLTCLQLTGSELPLLWDADFMYGPKDADGEDNFVLCEINVSCVSPYPEWANEPMARHLKTLLLK